jgi:hypothetical protein
MQTWSAVQKFNIEKNLDQLNLVREDIINL